MIHPIVRDPANVIASRSAQGNARAGANENVALARRTFRNHLRRAGAVDFHEQVGSGCARTFSFIEQVNGCGECFIAVPIRKGFNCRRIDVSAVSAIRLGEQELFCFFRVHIPEGSPNRVVTLPVKTRVSLRPPPHLRSQLQTLSVNSQPCGGMGVVQRPALWSDRAEIVRRLVDHFRCTIPEENIKVGRMLPCLRLMVSISRVAVLSAESNSNRTPMRSLPKTPLVSGSGSNNSLASNFGGAERPPVKALQYGAGNATIMNGVVTFSIGLPACDVFRRVLVPARRRLSFRTGVAGRTRSNNRQMLDEEFT